MGMKGKVVDVYVFRSNLDKLIIGAIQEVSNKDLFFVIVVDPPREKFDFFFDCFEWRNDNDITVRGEDFGYRRDLDLGRKGREVGYR